MPRSAKSKAPANFPDQVDELNNTFPFLFTS
jgi:hypothetical protein